MLAFLSRILFYLSSFSVLPPSRREQEKILKEVLKMPKRDIFLKRSLQQYTCHSYYFVSIIWFSFQFFSVFAILPLLFVLVLRSVTRPNLTKNKDIVLFPKVPDDIKSRFSLFYVKKPLGYLKFRDLKYVFKILFKSGFRPYFLFRSVWKIAVYSELIDTYQPERIWVTQEMVFESSLLTNYLDSFGIRHVNFMHGVNYFSIQVAFSSFHDFFIWDEFYIPLFKSLYVEADKFHLFSPLPQKRGAMTQKKIVKYYGQHSSNQKNFEIIVDNLVTFAKSKNCEPVVRLHPLHKQQFEIDILNNRKVRVEPNSLNLVDSLSEALYVCSEFSAVLYEAYLMNRKIVIDNSFPDRIERLKELDVIFFDKLPHEFLVQRA